MKRKRSESLSGSPSILDKNVKQLPKGPNIEKKGKDLQKMDDLILDQIKIAVRIFYGNLKVEEDKKKAHLMFLNQISSPHAWKVRRIIGSNQIQYFSDLARNEQECETMLKKLHKWTIDKINQIPGNKTKMEKINVVATCYKEEIERFGVNLQNLALNISQFTSEKATSGNSSKRSLNSVDSLYNSASDSCNTSHKENSTSESMSNQNECRLCGKKDSQLVINLSDKTKKITFKHTIEFYCRIKLEDDETLPQRVCVNCKKSLESFIQFCEKVDQQQNELKSTLKSNDKPPKIKQEPSDDYLNDCSVTVLNQGANEISEVLDEIVSDFDDFSENFEIVPHPDDLESEDSCSSSDPLQNNKKPVHYTEKLKDCNECYVAVESLPIKFIESDEDCETKQILKKRRFNKKERDKYSDNNNVSSFKLQTNIKQEKDIDASNTEDILISTVVHKSPSKIRNNIKVPKIVNLLQGVSTEQILNAKK